MVIASVLAMQPQVLVLDKPTASLEDGNVERLVHALAGLREILDITILMIEYRLTAALQQADRINVMEAGRNRLRPFPGTNI